MANEDQETSAGSALPAGWHEKPSSFSKQKFLSVHVPKGSSTAQIAAAVERALNAPDVPFFKDRTSDPAPPPSASPQRFAVGAAAVQADNGDGLLILVQQEGGP